MNHENTLLRVSKIVRILHQISSLKKLSQKNILQIQTFFKTHFDMDQLFELRCIEV